MDLELKAVVSGEVSRMHDHSQKQTKRMMDEAKGELSTAMDRHIRNSKADFGVSASQSHPPQIS